MGYCRRSAAHLPGLGAGVSHAQPDTYAGAYLQLGQYPPFYTQRRLCIPQPRVLRYVHKTLLLVKPKKASAAYRKA